MDLSSAADSFQMARLISAMAFIGTIIAIWLALRVANMTRENSESNVVTKLLSTGFGLCVMVGSWIQFSLAANGWKIFAGRLEVIGIENTPEPELAQGIIDFAGSTTPGMTPTPVGLAFLVIVTLIILGLIWGPKNN